MKPCIAVVKNSIFTLITFRTNIYGKIASPGCTNVHLILFILKLLRNNSQKITPYTHRYFFSRSLGFVGSVVMIYPLR